MFAVRSQRECVVLCAYTTRTHAAGKLFDTHAALMAGLLISTVSYLKKPHYLETPLVYLLFVS